MSEVTPRLERWIRATFTKGDAEAVLRTLHELPEQHERVLAALVIRTGGDTWKVHQNVQELRMDWRDVLLRGELGDDDWPYRLDAVLGPG